MSVFSNKDRSNMMWVEKYRPSSLNDVISHEDIVDTIRKLISQNALPHLLFYGPAGTGKTSTIVACAREIYKENFASMVLELNASDDRGINVVRNQIKTFSSTRQLFATKESKGYKLVILDEADHMTNDAQASLRRVVEQYAKNVRFCLCCNYVSKIIPALQSRCTKFRFQPLEKSLIKGRLEDIVKSENLKVDPLAVDGLVRISDGDMRKAINVLQASSLSADHISVEAVYDCVGQPTPEIIDQIFHALFNTEFHEAYNYVAQKLEDKGLALADVVRELHAKIIPGECAMPVVPRVRVEIWNNELADLEDRLCVASNEKIQLSSLVGICRQACVNIAQHC